jgi:hypothetical protein
MTRSLLLLAVIAGLTQQPHPRDSATAGPTRIGTASISGVVTAGDDARTPVRRAVVTVTTADGADSRSAISGDDGRFVIAGLPEGRYMLEATKPAHLSMSYGARRPGRPGTALVVADGQIVADIDVALPRGAVLAGRLTLENGQPLSNTQVMAIPARLATAGGVRLSGSDDVRTDDRGDFRLYGLLPGTYILAALPSFGRGDVERRAESDYDAIVRQLRAPATSAAGQPATISDGTTASAPLVGYAPTYFPGTPIATDAAPITVDAGDTRDGLGFTVSAVPMATISGTVLGVDGRPLQAVSLAIEPIGPTLPLSAVSGRRITRPDTDGAYSISGVGPGRYRVRARAGGVTLRPDGNLQAIRSDAQTLWAINDVSVTGDDLNGVTLQLQAGHVMSGRLVLADAAASPSWTGARVALEPTSSGNEVTINGIGPGVDPRDGAVEADGTFTVNGIEPSRYRVRVTLPAELRGQGWTLAALQHGERDLRDAPLTFADGSIAGINVVLTQAVTTLTGRLTTLTGTPASDYHVVIFPDDRTLWHEESPRILVLRPGVDGMFTSRELPPGTYRIAALVDVEDNEATERAFLESIFDAAVRVDLAAGRATRQDLAIR